MKKLNFVQNEIMLHGNLNGQGIINVLEVIYEQGHSGNSINYITGILKDKLSVKEIDDILKQQKDTYGKMVCRDAKAVVQSVLDNKLNDIDISCLIKLIDHKPLTPLTFEDSEWDKLRESEYQNKRCSAVFKDAENKPYYLYAMIKEVFKEDGTVSCWSGSMIIEETGERIRSAGYMKDGSFLETIRVTVREVEVAPDDWEMYVTQKELEKVLKHYDLMYI